MVRHGETRDDGTLSNPTRLHAEKTETRDQGLRGHGFFEVVSSQLMGHIQFRLS